MVGNITGDTMVVKEYKQQNSVYLSFRPVIVFSQVLGFCPVKNSWNRTATGLQFRSFNIHLLLALVFHIGISYFMQLTLEFRHQNWSVTIFYNLRKWCFLVALFTTEKERIFMFKALENFDDDIHKLNKVKLVDYNPGLRGKYWFFIYKLVYGIGVDLVSYTIFYPRGKSALALLADLVVKTFSAQMVFTYTIIYLTFSYEICYRYDLLKKSWIYHVSHSSSNPTVLLQSQETIRQLHNRLTSIAHKLSDCFGRFFVVNLFFVFLEVLMYFYRILHTNINVFSNVQSVVFLAMNVASVPILTSSTYYLTEASSNIVDELRIIYLADLPSECADQVELFLDQLASNPLKITACGFFVINRELITSMVMSLMTYLIVIIQIGSEFERLGANLLPSG